MTIRDAIVLQPDGKPEQKPVVLIREVDGTWHLVPQTPETGTFVQENK